MKTVIGDLGDLLDVPEETNIEGNEPQLDIPEDTNSEKNQEEDNNNVTNEKDQNDGDSDVVSDVVAETGPFQDSTSFEIGRGDSSSDA